MDDTPDVSDLASTLADLGDGLTPDAIRPHVLRVAQQVLTGRQLEALMWWLGGDTLQVVADRMGISRQAVHQHLHGQAGPGKGRGAISRLKAAMADDAEVKALRSPTSAPASSPTAEQADAGDTVRRWFTGVRHHTLSHFHPLAVLLVAHYAADAGRRVTYSELYALVPREAVAAAIPLLKHVSPPYIATDGITIRILRTPLDEVTQ